MFDAHGFGVSLYFVLSHLIPPFSKSLKTHSNTFPPGEDTFMPKINFSHPRLDFPSCHVDKSVYRTVRVSNTGDTPVKFAILDTSPSSTVGIGGGTALASCGGAAFSVKPRVGILRRGEARLIVFRFSPSEERGFEMGLRCLFNSSRTNSYVGGSLFLFFRVGRDIKAELVLWCFFRTFKCAE